MPFIPVPMPKTVCRTDVYDKIAQLLEVCRTLGGQGYLYEYDGSEGAVGARLLESRAGPEVA